MDTCTLIIITTLLATPCHSEKRCSFTIDMTKQICTEFCAPAPQSYKCVKPDGSDYIWTPTIQESSVLLKAN